MLSSGGCLLPLGAAAQAGGHLLHLALQLQQQATDEAWLPGAICTWCPALVLLMQPVWFPPDGWEAVPAHLLVWTWEDTYPVHSVPWMSFLCSL